MGDFSQYLWVKKNIDLIKSDVIEIGSKFYSDNTFSDYRSLCIKNNKNYLGIDLSEGKNVDHVIDFTEDITLIEKTLKEKKLNTKYSAVICCSVLEHVKDIFSFAKNISTIIEPGGTLFISVPFSWEYHGYPSDYWRFTPNAIEYLFDSFSFKEEFRTISSHQDGDMQGIIQDPNDFSYRQILDGVVQTKFQISNYEIFKAIYHLIKFKKIYNQKVLFNSINTTRYLKPSCINMIGTKLSQNEKHLI